MRIGINPTKLDNKINVHFYHRVILPVYIPNLEGYFKDAIQILELCFTSLYRTSSKGTAITVIDNACCNEAKNYLEKQFAEGRIDQLIVNKINLGKVDPIMSIVRGCHEALITISDSDVLFKNGWLQAVQDVFAHFPKAGMVSSTPGALAFQDYCASTLWDNKFSSSLKFRQLVDPKDLRMFVESIGRPNMYNQHHYKNQLSLENNGLFAVVGCGHFVLTCRREAFDLAPKMPSKFLIEGNSEGKYIDQPNDVGGYWKLGTVKNLTYHMGNIWEPWMDEYFKEVREDRSNESFHLLASKPTTVLPYRIKAKLIESLFKIKFLRNIFFKRCGAKFPINEYLRS